MTLINIRVRACVYGRRRADLYSLVSGCCAEFRFRGVYQTGPLAIFASRDFLLPVPQFSSLFLPHYLPRVLLFQLAAAVSTFARTKFLSVINFLLPPPPSLLRLSLFSPFFIIVYIQPNIIIPSLETLYYIIIYYLED